MEPLSAIASVITVAQALGVGVGALRTLSNSSDEFNDMVAELSKLKSCMDQLCSTINKVEDPRLSLPAKFSRGLMPCDWNLARSSTPQGKSKLGYLESRLPGGRR